MNPFPAPAFLRFVLLLAVVATLLVGAVDGRHQRHQTKGSDDTTAASDSDYVYRDVTTDYSEGLFVDSVPIKTTPYSAPHLKHPQQRTNRIPKLRKFINSDLWIYQ